MDLDIDLSKTAQSGDLILEKINRLREAHPVYWSEASQCWFVTRHQDVLDGFGGKYPLASHQFPEALHRLFSPAELQAKIPNTLRYLSQMSVNLDPPDHTRVRALLVKAFRKNIVESLRPFVRQRVNELLDQAQIAGAIEFNEQIARQLPGSVILRLIGLPDSCRPRLKTWANAFLTALGSGVPKIEWLVELELCVMEMNEFFEAAIAERRKAPREDLISALLQASDGEDRLSHDEVLATLHVTVVAGHDSTTSSLSLGLAALARHPDQWMKLRERPELAASAVDEIMRYSAMSTAMQRIASKDFQWHGQHIKQNQFVILMMAGGNRDPRVYANPEQLDITRKNDRSLTFGPGLHFCVGHLLAKLQLGECFAAIVNRFDAVELLDARLDFMPQIVFRGLWKLNVRFHPRKVENAA
jgi:cytochrome P450